MVAADAQAEGAAAVPMSDSAFVSVIGASRATPEPAGQAAELGELLAEPLAVVMCGGRIGVMKVRAGGEGDHRRLRRLGHALGDRPGTQLGP